ncbi:hypothetical protein FKM82_022769 [Ascaphus truei]
MSNSLCIITITMSHSLCIITITMSYRLCIITITMSHSLCIITITITMSYSLCIIYTGVRGLCSDICRVFCMNIALLYPHFLATLTDSLGTPHTVIVI